MSKKKARKILEKIASAEEALVRIDLLEGKK